MENKKFVKVGGAWKFSTAKAEGISINLTAPVEDAGKLVLFRNTQKQDILKSLENAKNEQDLAQKERVAKWPDYNVIEAQ